MLVRQGGQPVEVDAMRVRADAVADEMVELARDVQPHAVRQVAAVGKVEPQHGVARLQECEVDRRVGLGTGVRLDVGMVGAENLLRPCAGQLFGHVDELAAAIIAMAGIALGIFVRQHAAGGLHDRGAGVVFRRDHFQPTALAVDLAGNRGPKLRVLSLDAIHQKPSYRWRQSFLPTRKSHCRRPAAIRQLGKAGVATERRPKPPPCRRLNDSIHAGCSPSLPRRCR